MPPQKWRSERYITRTPQGWHVRIYRTIKGQRKYFAKFFGDATHGGPKKGLALVRAWRDEMLAKLPPPQPSNGGNQPVPAGYGYTRKARVKVVSSNGNSRMIWVWTAWMRLEDGRNAGTRWSIPKWGSKEAERRAEAWLDNTRQEMWKRLWSKKAKKRRSKRPRSRG